ncbi:hypothetical protein J7J84_02390 [bacterium]|nr:hypothetical protein [bacterium]
MAKHITLSVVAVLALLALVTACGSNARRASLPGELQPGITGGERAPVSVEDALVELEELPVPEGVDPAIFDELRQSLAEALTERSGEKHVSSEPSDEGRRVRDLTLHVEPGGNSATLEWNYRNDGDYNQDGRVDIADIVPLALHFGEDATDPNSLAGVADGNHNGRVGMSDVTPIATNYGAEVVAYSVNYSAYEWYAYWESPFDYGYIGAVELSDGLGKENGRVRFSYDLSYNASYWYRVLPLNSRLEIGPVSDLAVSEDSYMVSGYVLDREYQGIPGVPLLLDGERETVTDASGEFCFSGVPPGAHTLAPSTTSMLFFPESRNVSVKGASVFSCIFGAERALPGNWHATNLSNLGYISSLAVINGNLAVSLRRFRINYEGADIVAYIQATDPYGLTWGMPSAVAQSAASYALLAQVNWHPAAVYYYTYWAADYSIYYVRANDPDGTSWGEPLELAIAGQYSGVSFTTIQGRPAAAYCGRTSSGNLYYRMSIDRDGNEWLPEVKVASKIGESGRSSLTEIDGRPSIAYANREDEGVFFTIADDLDGTSWSIPVKAGYIDGSTTYNHVSLAMISDKPAIAFSRGLTDQVLYSEALDTEGTEWSEPFLLNHWHSGEIPILCAYYGEPAVAYRTSYGCMFCTRREGIWSFTRTPGSRYLYGLVIHNGTPTIANRQYGYSRNWIARLE